MISSAAVGAQLLPLQAGIGPPPKPCGGLLTSILRPCFCATASGGFGSVIVRTPSLNCGRDLIGLDLVGHGHRPLERAVGALGAVYHTACDFLFLFVLGSLLAFDRQLIADQRDLDVVLFDAGQLGGERDGLVVFGDVDAWCEDAAHAAAEPILEQRVDLVLEPAEMLDIAIAVSPWREPTCWPWHSYS